MTALQTHHDTAADPQHPVMRIREMFRKASKLRKEDKADIFDLIADLIVNFPTTDQLTGRLVGSLNMMQTIVSGNDKKVDLTPVECPVAEAEPERPARLTKWTDWIAYQIKELRTQRGWSQDDLASRTGLPQSHICRLELGKHSPSRKTLTKLAKAFDMPVETLAHDSYWKNPQKAGPTKKS